MNFQTFKEHIASLKVVYGIREYVHSPAVAVIKESIK